MENQNYTHYGDEWKKEMAKLPKAFLIDIAAKLGQEKEAIKERIKAEVNELDNPVGFDGRICVPYFSVMNIIDNL